jgi:hypothetical protein
MQGETVEKNINKILSWGHLLKIIQKFQNWKADNNNKFMCW